MMTLKMILDYSETVLQGLDISQQGHTATETIEGVLNGGVYWWY